MNTSTPNIRSFFSKVENKPSANSTLAIGGVSSPPDSFEVAESLVLRINICGENRQLLKPAKRWWQVQRTTEFNTYEI